MFAILGFQRMGRRDGAVMGYVVKKPVWQTKSMTAHEPGLLINYSLLVRKTRRPPSQSGLTACSTWALETAWWSKFLNLKQFFLDRRGRLLGLRK